MSAPVSPTYRDDNSATSGPSHTTDPSATGRGPTNGRTDTDEGIGQLLSEVISDVTRLFRKEVELAKVELKAEAGKAGKAGGMLAAGGVAGLLTAVMVSLALAALLDEVMHPALAALVVGVLWAAAGAALYSAGRTRLRQVSPVPQQTVESVKEDVEWLRKQNA
jgi:hypothetical protein